MNELRADNVSIIMMSPDFANECDMVEPLYKASYKIEDIPKQWKEQWQNLEKHPDMFMPETNIYIPKDLSLKPLDNSLIGKKYPER